MISLACHPLHSSIIGLHSFQLFSPIILGRWSCELHLVISWAITSSTCGGTSPVAGTAMFFVWGSESARTVVYQLPWSSRATILALQMNKTAGWDCYLGVQVGTCSAKIQMLAAASPLHFSFTIAFLLAKTHSFPCDPCGANPEWRFPRMTHNAERAECPPWALFFHWRNCRQGRLEDAENVHGM